MPIAELISRAAYWKTRKLAIVYRRLPGGSWVCPCCSHRGRFAPCGGRSNSVCPGCGSAERHRLQATVIDRLLVDRHTFGDVLHVAPEAQIASRLRPAASSYTTADLNPEGVDLIIDLRNCALPDNAYDMVYASHVLEHIDDDASAIAEIHRILRPGGVAVLPVPVTQPSTVEFAEPWVRDDYHVRNPGPDYFDRYRMVFSRVDVTTSPDAPAEHQTYVYLGRGMPRGSKVYDFVPVCHKAA
jgi:SAM-dependent methyltransferase